MRRKKYGKSEKRSDHLFLHQNVLCIQGRDKKKEADISAVVHLSICRFAVTSLCSSTGESLVVGQLVVRCRQSVLPARKERLRLEAEKSVERYTGFTAVRVCA